MKADRMLDLDDLITEFGADSVEALALSIEEAADIDDDRIVTIDAIDPAHPMLVIGTRGLEIVFPITTRELLTLAAEVERELEATE